MLHYILYKIRNFFNQQPRPEEVVYDILILNYTKYGMDLYPIIHSLFNLSKNDTKLILRYIPALIEVWEESGKHGPCPFKIIYQNNNTYVSPQLLLHIIHGLCGHHPNDCVLVKDYSVKRAVDMARLVQECIIAYIDPRNKWNNYNTLKTYRLNHRLISRNITKKTTDQTPTLTAKVKPLESTDDITTNTETDKPVENNVIHIDVNDITRFEPAHQISSNTIQKFINKLCLGRELRGKLIREVISIFNSSYINYCKFNTCCNHELHESTHNTLIIDPNYSISTVIYKELLILFSGNLNVQPTIVLMLQVKKHLLPKEPPYDHKKEGLIHSNY